MNIIKKLEAWLVSKNWVYLKIEKLKTYFTKILQEQQLRHYSRYIKKEAAKLSLKKEEEQIVITIANNILRSACAKLNTADQKISIKVLVDLGLKTGRRIVREIGPFVGIQPIETPVGRLRSLRFVNVETKKPIADGDYEELLWDKLTLEIIETSVEAKSQKMEAGWSLEVMQGMNTAHGLDIETEITQAMSYEIADAVFNQIYDSIRESAKCIKLNLPSFDYSEASFDDFKTIGIAINRASIDIARTTRRGTGNFIITSPLIVSILQTAPASIFTPRTDVKFEGPGSLMFVGTLNGTIKVYSSIHNINKNQILVGYKGTSELDTGYVYSPYQLILEGGIVINPVSISPVTNLFTRSGHTLIDPNYYRIIDL